MSKIELSEEDIELYTAFQKHYVNFGFLIRKGALSEQAGEVTFEKDPNGVITRIYVTHSFKRTALDKS